MMDEILASKTPLRILFLGARKTGKMHAQFALLKLMQPSLLTLLSPEGQNVEYRARWSKWHKQHEADVQLSQTLTRLEMQEYFPKGEIPFVICNYLYNIPKLEVAKEPIKSVKEVCLTVCDPHAIKMIKEGSFVFVTCQYIQNQKMIDDIGPDYIIVTSAPVFSLRRILPRLPIAVQMQFNYHDFGPMTRDYRHLVYCCRTKTTRIWTQPNPHYHQWTSTA